MASESSTQSTLLTFSAQHVDVVELLPQPDIFDLLALDSGTLLIWGLAAVARWLRRLMNASRACGFAAAIAASAAWTRSSIALPRALNE